MAESPAGADTPEACCGDLHGTSGESRVGWVTSVDEFLTVMRDHDTATAALIAWCRWHHPHEADAITITLLGDEAVSADRYDGPLRPNAGETLRRRHVWLRWGDRVLSEAENWYVPERLPSEMQDEICGGGRPYGAVVAALRPKRITKFALCADNADPDIAEVEALLAELGRTNGFSQPDAFVLHIHAVMTASGIVLAELREHYRRELLP